MFKILKIVTFFFEAFIRKACGDISFSAKFSQTYNIKLGKNVKIYYGSRLSAAGGVLIIGDNCMIDSNVIISCHGGTIEIGEKSSFNPNCVIYGHGGLKIGKFVRVAAGTVIIPANHGFERKDIPIAEQSITKKGIVIKDDVWIGANCVILDGVMIGTGCVIGAGSIVTKSIPSYSIAVGNPARVIKER